MSRLKDELNQWMGKESKFHQRHEQQVLEKLQQTRSNKGNNHFWRYPVTVAAFIVVSLLFIVVGFWQPTDEKMSKEQALEVFIEKKLDDSRLLYQEHALLHKDDALVISQNQDGVFVMSYLQYEKNQWIYIGSCGIRNDQDEPTMHFSRMVSQPFLYCGVIAGENVKDVIVGQKTPTFVEVDNNLKLWFAFGNDVGERVVFQMADGTKQRMHEIEWTDRQPNDIAVVSRTDEDMVIWSYSGYGMRRGNNEYEQFPLVIDPTPQIENLTRGDVIYFTKMDLTKKDPVYAKQRELARIIALPGESIEIRNGTVIVNKIPLDVSYGFAAIDGEAVFENYVDYVKQQDMNINIEGVREIYFRNMDERMLGPHEYFVIGDNWGSGTMQVLQSTEIEGNVLGYELEALKEEWTAQEVALYEQFKKDNDATIFRGIDPITIARVQLFAQFMADQQTVYRLYTTRREDVQWSESLHMQEHTMIEADKERFAAYQMAQQLAKGSFQLLDQDYKGIIVFKQDNSNEEAFWRMIQNEQGIWQVAFLPLQ